MGYSGTQGGGGYMLSKGWLTWMSPIAQRISFELYWEHIRLILRTSQEPGMYVFWSNKDFAEAKRLTNACPWVLFQQSLDSGILLWLLETIIRIWANSYRALTWMFPGAVWCQYLDEVLRQDSPKERCLLMHNRMNHTISLHKYAKDPREVRKEWELWAPKRCISRP